MAVFGGVFYSCLTLAILVFACLQPTTAAPRYDYWSEADEDFFTQTRNGVWLQCDGCIASIRGLEGRVEWESAEAPTSGRDFSSSNRRKCQENAIKYADSGWTRKTCCGGRWVTLRDGTTCDQQVDIDSVCKVRIYARDTYTPVPPGGTVCFSKMRRERRRRGKKRSFLLECCRTCSNGFWSKCKRRYPISTSRNAPVASYLIDNDLEEIPSRHEKNEVDRIDIFEE